MSICQQSISFSISFFIFVYQIIENEVTKCLKSILIEVAMNKQIFFGLVTGIKEEVQLGIQSLQLEPKGDSWCYFYH